MTLRRQTEADLDFAAALYASTRADELRPVAWPDEIKRAFLQSQFDAQWTHYSKHYHDADFLIIERAGAAIGRLYVWRDEDDICIVDIALLPEERGGGIGGALVREVIDEATRSGKSVSLHVEHHNPAQRLYRRLGFEQAGSDGVYARMIRRAPETT